MRRDVSSLLDFPHRAVPSGERNGRFHYLARRYVCLEWTPSQDLFVLAESPRLSVLHALFSPRTLIFLIRVPNPSFQIHLCSMSSGKAHELASVPILKYPHCVPEYMMSFSIQISGEHLGVEFRGNDTTELVVWNWKTGQKELVCFLLLMIVC